MVYSSLLRQVGRAQNGTRAEASTMEPVEGLSDPLNDTIAPPPAAFLAHIGGLP